MSSVYCLIENGKAVRYFGITAAQLKTRLRQHIEESIRLNENERHRWVRECIEQNRAITIHPIRLNIKRSEALRVERGLVRMFKTAFSLVNTTTKTTLIKKRVRKGISLKHRSFLAKRRVGLLRPKWRIQIADTESGRTRTWTLHKLPWPGRYVDAEHREFSAAKFGRVVATIIGEAA